jgi:hypothetical protein
MTARRKHRTRRPVHRALPAREASKGSPTGNRTDIPHDQRALARAARERATATGVNYTAARAALIAERFSRPYSRNCSMLRKLGSAPGA